MARANATSCPCPNAKAQLTNYGIDAPGFITGGVYFQSMKRKLLLILSGALLLIILLCGLGGLWAWQKSAPSSPVQKKIARAVKPYRFDLLHYEIGAITSKIRERITRPGARLTPEEQKTLVENYVTLARQARHLEAEINRIYADPQQEDPAAASADLQQRLDELKQLMQEMRPLVENILQRQVGSTLKEMGLDTAGQVWPPLAFKFSDLPKYLIASPRDHIELIAGVHLRPSLTIAQRERIEEEVAKKFQLSTLVEELGGLGVWPTMLTDEADLPWILDTIAHEWLHTYMIFHPLGWHMFDNPQMDTINETVATIVGQEVGAETAWRYYGIPRPKPQPLPETPAQLPPPDPNKFDFRLEMRRTRLKVDELLKQGKIEEAERYMEARRKLFVEHGYYIRKLNQAYFAFHGSYATSSASTDPIGPKLRELRSLMPDLATFVHQVQRISKPEDLDELLDEWRATN